MAKPAPIPVAVLSTPQGLLATGFGSGLSPWAPGTVGSLAAMPMFWFLWPLPPLLYWLVVAGVFLLGVWASQRLSDDLKVHDHGGIVIDEFVGVYIALAGCPRIWWLVVLGWLAFRFFDILKPPPIGWLDRRVSGGFGIMVDDVLAGLYALAIVQLTAALVLR
ncbi:MAG: phosphatidylglycerophosphatase A [Lysobacterales bacterium]